MPQPSSVLQISRAIGVDMSFVKDIRLVQRNWKEGNQGTYCVILLFNYTVKYISTFIADN